MVKPSSVPTTQLISEYHPRTNHILRGTDVYLWAAIGVVLFFTLGTATVAAIALVRQQRQNRSIRHLIVDRSLRVGQGTPVQWLTQGHSEVELSTTSLPTETPVLFPSAAPLTPRVFVSLVQPHEVYTGLTLSAARVSTTGFKAVVDAVRTGKVDESGKSVTLASRVVSLTTPLTVVWFAIV